MALNICKKNCKIVLRFVKVLAQNAHFLHLYGGNDRYNDKK